MIGNRTFSNATLAATIVAAFFFVGVVFPTTTSAFNTVIIDAGHGGHDLGASDSLVYEKHMNLDVARRLQLALKRAGYKTVMIRNDDKFVPLDTRAAIANRYRKAVFISIHFNSSYKNKVSGIETYYRSSTGRNFATLIQNELIRAIGSPNRGVKTANFVVLRKTRHPAVLIEGGFVSNKTDRDAMMDPRYRQAIVDGVARAVVNFDRRY